MNSGVIAMLVQLISVSVNAVNHTLVCKMADCWKSGSRFTSKQNLMNPKWTKNKMSHDVTIKRTDCASTVRMQTCPFCPFLCL